MNAENLMPDYGFTCWSCRKDINCGPVGYAEAEDIAGVAGWVIGHWDGQGQIACDECRETVWDPCLLGTSTGRAALRKAGAL